MSLFCVMKICLLRPIRTLTVSAWNDHDRLPVIPGISADDCLRLPARQQLQIAARLSNGTVRDVTRISTYAVSNVRVARVDANGLVTGLDRRQTAVVVRFRQLRLPSICLSSRVVNQSLNPSETATLFHPLHSGRLLLCEDQIN